jgi:DNA-binding NarL/FixJ family response regulator
MRDNKEPERVNTIVVSRPGVMRQALQTALAAYAWLDITATVGDGLTALNNAFTRRPDLLIIDSNLLDEEVEALLVAIKAKMPQTRCLVFIQSNQRAGKVQALGADGVFLRGNSTQELQAALLQLV